MNAVDTNILVRYFLEDDETQFQIVKEFLSNKVTFISQTVLLETLWALKYIYDFSPHNILVGLDQLLDVEQFFFECEDRIQKVLEWCQSTNMDIADAFHLAATMENEHKMVTFDKSFVREAQKLNLAVILLSD